MLNGFAVVLPRAQLGRLARVGGVARVWPSIAYHPLLDRTPQLVGAPTLWGPTLTTAGQGVKIGIIDDGIDQTHPFFAPAGFAYPPGFPKGQTAYTTPKVIVARAFPPPHASYKNAGLPFDPSLSDRRARRPLGAVDDVHARQQPALTAGAGASEPLREPRLLAELRDHV